MEKTPLFEYHYLETKKNVFRIIRISGLLSFICVFKLLATGINTQNTTINLSENTVKTEQLSTLQETLPPSGMNNEFENDQLTISERTITTKTQQSRIRVTGVVLDDRGDPVIGANVVEKGTTDRKSVV